MEQYKVSVSEVARALNTISYVDQDTPSEKTKSLYGNLMLPSYVHGYSLAIEYMSKWFERGFKKDFFKSIYIDGKHVIDDYKKFSKLMVKGENPRARIAPTVQFDYDREGVDFYMAPPNVYLRRSKWQEAFFKDPDRNIYLGVVLRAMRMDFNFKVRVNTRSQQLDVFNQMELNFRVGATQSEYISADFHIPKSIILNIAGAAGFAVKDGEVLDIISFLSYLNSHSDIPFLFKMRAINQKPEYFIRVNNIYCHISNKDKLSLDDGEREGKLDFNFHVEMNSTLTMPVPHYYAFYSADKLTTDIELKEPIEGTVPIYSINLIDIPEYDEHGWPQGCITDYLCDEGDTSIDLNDLFVGDNLLTRAINHDLALNVSPSKFISVKVYRDLDIAREVEFDMDWQHKTLYFKHPETEETLHIAIYFDRQYFNELNISLDNYQKSRFSPKTTEE
jgi:hypothetical protein